MTQQSKFAYLAGFVDGEGSFSITKSLSGRKRDGSKYVTHKLSLSVANTNRDVMDWIAKTFGGKVLTGSNQNRNPKYKTRYSWTLSSFKDIERVTISILPYLIVKRQQAILTLEFCQTANVKIGEWLSSDVQIKRDHLRREMMCLNGIFCPPPVSVESIRQAPTRDEDVLRSSGQPEEAGRNDQLPLILL